MRSGSSHAVRQARAAALVVLGLSLSGAAIASAEPGQPPAPASAVACERFAGAWRVSSAYYNAFAYSIAGTGAYVDYQDPTVRGNNVDGRTALRKAAAEALSASGTPGLAPEIAAPMRSWSLRATKLLLAMGLHGNGDTLNAAATELNMDATDTKMACAQAGART